MDELSSWYRIGLILFSLAWLWPLLALWSRYDRVTSPHFTLLAVLTAAGMMLNLLLISLQDSLAVPQLNILAISVLPVLGMIAVFITSQRLLRLHQQIENVHYGVLLFFLAATFLWFWQVPLFEVFFHQSQVVDFVDNAYTRLLAVLAAGVAPVYLLWLLRLLDSYHRHLAEHVADVKRYQHNGLTAICQALFSLHLAILALTLIIWLQLLPFPNWYEYLCLLQGGSLYVLVLYLVAVRRVAPCPVDYQLLASAAEVAPPYSEQELTSAIDTIEAALVASKAYRKRGVQLQPICRLADISAELAILAIKNSQKRNFRALIYHHRLQYAKLLLLKTDLKVSAVAERLGFNSERYLSDMFVTYIQQEKLGQSQPAAIAATKD